MTDYVFISDLRRSVTSKDVLQVDQLAVPEVTGKAAKRQLETMSARKVVI